MLLKTERESVPELVMGCQVSVQEACVCDIEYKRKEWEMYIKESSKLKKEGRKRSGGQVVISGKEPKHKKIANPPCDVKTEEVHSGKVKNLLPAHTYHTLPGPSPHITKEGP